MKTIYLDVLIVLNIYVNFFLLKAAARFTHTPLRTLRCVSASLIGSMFSLVILLPPHGTLLPLIFKLTASAVIVFSAFGRSDIRLFLRRLLYFYIINFIFAGAVMLLYITFKPAFMSFNNSYFYVDLSLISLVFFTLLSYLAVSGVRFLMDRRSDTKKKYTVRVSQGGREAVFEGIADTGNSLIDVFSGKPVVICPKKALGYCGDSLELCEKYGFRPLPYSTISGSGIIAAFSPDCTQIKEEESGRIYKADVLIGLSDNTSRAVFDPKILI